VTISPAISEAWRQVLDDASTTNWITAGYDGSAITLLSTGSGGLAEFKTQLGSDIIYGGFRCTGVDDRGNTVSRRPKFVFVAYLPQSAPTMRRARAGGVKGAMKAVLTSTHCDFQIEDAGDITEAEVIAKLRACGGAHQPTGYEF
jgi:hypothetical protein